jgi:hypothetical protein
MTDQPGNPYAPQPDGEGSQGGSSPAGGNNSSGGYPAAGGYSQPGGYSADGTYPPGANNPSGGYPQAGQYPGGEFGGYGYASGSIPAGGAPLGNQQWGAPQQGQAAAEARGFFSALFDMSFQSFIAIKFARFIYMFFIIVFALLWIIGLLSSLGAAVAGDGGWLVLVAFVLFGWIPPLIYIVLIRLSLEFMIALVRTSQNTAGTRQEIEGLRRELRSQA